MHCPQQGLHYKTVESNRVSYYGRSERKPRAENMSDMERDREHNTHTERKNGNVG